MQLNTSVCVVGPLILVILLCLLLIFCFLQKNKRPWKSHLFQDPKEHVVLTREYHRGGCGVQESDFFRIYPNGTKDETPFRVPQGRLLVVTDVDWWLADFKSPFNEGGSTYFELALEHQTGSLFTYFRVFKDTGKVDHQNRLGRSVCMTAGFVVAPETRICPFAQVPSSNDTEFLRINIILRGYLIDGVSDTAREEHANT